MNKSRYFVKQFASAAAVLWLLIACFAAFIYIQGGRLRQKSVIDSVDLATVNLFSTYARGGDMQKQLGSIERYFSASLLSDLSIQVYDTRTQKLLYSIGEVRDYIPEASLDMKRVKQADGSLAIRVTNTSIGPDKEKIFFYSSELSPDGTLDIRCYLPRSEPINRDISIPVYVWLMVLGLGLVGTGLAWVVTAHNARNIKLLSDFARRATDDSDFIPLADFPNDELGDISRLIVTIYNQRMQSNVRREREHVIALKAIEEQNRMKLVLTNNIGHELKTPIGIIGAYVSTMLNQPDMDEEDRHHFLTRIEENVQRITNMLSSLSTMTRLNESGKNMPLTTINFHNLVFSLVDEFTKLDVMKGIEFHYNIPYNCEVIGNEAYLTSALTNLVKNAINYAQCSVIGIDLIRRAPEYYTFSFYDNGVGVGEEHIQHLFERFYRVDTGRSRKNGGTGLGLSIVKSAINGMGGSISARNRKGGGLEFIFTLRRPQADEAENSDLKPNNVDDSSTTPEPADQPSNAD